MVTSWIPCDAQVAASPSSSGSGAMWAASSSTTSSGGSSGFPTCVAACECVREHLLGEGGEVAAQTALVVGGGAQVDACGDHRAGNPARRGRAPSHRAADWVNGASTVSAVVVRPSCVCARRGTRWPAPRRGPPVAPGAPGCRPPQRLPACRPSARHRPWCDDRASLRGGGGQHLGRRGVPELAVGGRPVRFGFVAQVGGDPAGPMPLGAAGEW